MNHMRPFLLWPLAIALIVIGLSQPALAQNKALLLFGGSDHDQFLGCVNCNKYSAESICNQYGQYGSEYQADSIWNAYGTYGSKYNSLSPWNAYTSTPPVIVDPYGGIYGYLTANKYHAQRTNIQALDSLTDAAASADDIASIRTLWCGES